MFLVCGEAVIDFFQDGTSGLAFAGQAAGSPLNVAIGLKRLGHAASFVTGLSRDAFASRLIAQLDKEGVDWSLAPRTDRPTILSFIMVKADGGPEYAFYGERGADTDVPKSAFAQPLPADIRAIHVGGFPMAVEPAKSSYAGLIQREATQRFVSLDPNVRPALVGDIDVYRDHFESLCRSASLIKASSEDIEHIYGGAALRDIAERWRALGAGTVVVTDGPNGAFSLNDADLCTVPTAKVDVVDTVGAGDSFMSALLAGIADRSLLDRGALASASGQMLSAILAFANRAAGITCTRRGANPPRLVDLS